MNQDFEIESGVLIEYHGRDENVIIPDGVKSIGNSAFEYCKNLFSVTIPDSVKNIGNSAFCGCKLLESVIIPDSVTIIGDSAFYNCTNLTSVTIGNSVKNIGNRAFQECSRLISVIIPDSVKSIEEWAFYDCSSLISVTIRNSATSMGWRAFCACSSLTSVTVDGAEINLPSPNFRDKTHIFFLLVGKNYQFTAPLNRTPDVTNNLIFQMYASGLDEKGASAYISENFSAMFPVLINMNNTEILRKILDSEKFITKKNIDDLIQYAIDQKKYQLQLMLTEYKQQKNWYQNIDDIDKKFKL